MVVGVITGSIVYQITDSNDDNPSVQDTRIDDDSSGGTIAFPQFEASLFFYILLPPWVNYLVLIFLLKVQPKLICPFTSHMNFAGRKSKRFIVSHTVRKSQLMSENSIFRKIQNSEFEFLKLESHDFWKVLNASFPG